MLTTAACALRIQPGQYHIIPDVLIPRCHFQGVLSGVLNMYSFISSCSHLDPQPALLPWGISEMGGTRINER